MALRDELQAAIARADALERTVRDLEQRLQSAGAGDLKVEAARLVSEREQAQRELARLVSERGQAQQELARLLSERDQARRDHEGAVTRVRLLEDRLKASISPHGDAQGMRTLWDNNREVAALEDFSQDARLGVTCPRCAVEGVDVELVKRTCDEVARNPGDILCMAGKRIALLPAVCPRCLLCADFAWTPRSLKFRVLKRDELVRELTVAKGTLQVGDNEETCDVYVENFVRLWIANLPTEVQLHTYGDHVHLNGSSVIDGMLRSGDHIASSDDVIVVQFE